MSALIPAKTVARELPTPTTGALSLLVVAGGGDVVRAACVAVSGRAWACCAVIAALIERVIGARRAEIGDLGVCGRGGIVLETSGGELSTATGGAIAILAVARGGDVFCVACVAVTGRACPCCAALWGLAERCVRVRVCGWSAV